MENNKGIGNALLRYFATNNVQKETRNDESDYTAYSPLNSNSLLFGTRSNTTCGALNLSAVYRCTEIITNALAQLDIVVKKKTARGKTTVVKNHAVNLLFEDKTNYLDKYTFIKMMIQSVIIKGNGFAYIQRDGSGTPTHLRYLETQDVNIIWHKERNELYYQIPILGKSKVLPKDLLHFKLFSNDGIKGISILAHARRVIAIGGATDNQAEKFFSNGTALSGIISVPQHMSGKQKQELLGSWNTIWSNGGEGLAVVDGGASYQSISLSSKDSQMIESREFNVLDIARFFGVPASLLNVSGFNGKNTLEDEQANLLVNTLMPYIRMVEAEFAKKLLNGNETNLKVILDTENYLRSNKASLSSYLTSLVQNGIMTVNEARKQLGLSEVENGDNLLIAYSDTAQNTIGSNDVAEAEKLLK
jgi:HK97 family phage portal protein